MGDDGFRLTYLPCEDVDTGAAERSPLAFYDSGYSLYSSYSDDSGYSDDSYYRGWVDKRFNMFLYVVYI